MKSKIFVVTLLTGILVLISAVMLQPTAVAQSNASEPFLISKTVTVSPIPGRCLPNTAPSRSCPSASPGKQNTQGEFRIAETKEKRNYSKIVGDGLNEISCWTFQTGQITDKVLGIRSARFDLTYFQPGIGEPENDSFQFGALRRIGNLQIARAEKGDTKSFNLLNLYTGDNALLQLKKFFRSGRTPVCYQDDAFVTAATLSFVVEAEKKPVKKGE